MADRSREEFRFLLALKYVELERERERGGETNKVELEKKSNVIEIKSLELRVLFFLFFRIRSTKRRCCLKFDEILVSFFNPVSLAVVLVWPQQQQQHLDISERRGGEKR